MIIWGWQTRSIDLGQHQIYQCGNCGQQRPFRLAFHYTFFRLYFLFGMVYVEALYTAVQLLRKGMAAGTQPNRA